MEKENNVVLDAVLVCIAIVFLALFAFMTGFYVSERISERQPKSSVPKIQITPGNNGIHKPNNNSKTQFINISFNS